MLGCQRDQFSLAEDYHYLNCAYMAPVSRRVEQVGIAGIRRKRDPTEILPDDFFAGPDTVRHRFAELLGVPEPERIAIIPAASYGLAVAARNTPVTAEQNVVIVAEQFPSNVYIWRRICDETGAELRRVRRPTVPAGGVWTEAVCEGIDSATAAVAVPQVHWTDGTRFDLAAIGRRAREVGAVLVVDGTQSIGAMPFDLESIRPDAVVCAGYKWLMGPYATGVAYYGDRYERGVPLEETWIARMGSEDFQRLVDYRDEYRPGSVRYDVGEASNFILMPMLAEALAQILGWGVPEIADYCGRLLRTVEEEARARGWTVPQETDRGPHILGIGLPGSLDPERLRNRLRDRNVAASLRGDSLRISPHVYNDEDDIGALLDVLRAGFS